ncbi:hypothetical protein A9P82_07800 [Arachidicoccus ginsenosidimutans]|uniref:lysylphosphatidylglycerol synthase domain-containing protein n=1 Tax=Arachidicoccus sp. BS20 TaxID=1850526 RepID=UPI0007F0CADF|nr:lysylphosphatidylglycerol synthase domain-containing protein [Arachidicoccus sp. BS20]ANI89202.1 hypothetical protein A9P82_07800 [Arachidicoccus sp. BS20]
MNLNPRYKKILNYVVGPVLFVILAFSIYHKIVKQPHLKESWQSIRETIARHYYLLALMIALMFINWTIEARKWQLLIRPVQRVSLFTGFKAVLSGLSLSLFIPNGAGEYLGRMLYMSEGNRLRSVAVSFVGSLSQLLVTLIVGVIGLHYLLANVPAFGADIIGLNKFWLKALLYAVYIFIVFFLLLYFKISLFVTWFEKIPFVYKHRVLINSLESFHKHLLLRILLLSFFRYTIFIAQYVLMFYLFNVSMPLFWAIGSASVFFLLLAIVPTVPIAELGVRGEISIRVFGALAQNTLGIISATGFIWLLNIIIPSLAGSLFVLSLRIFKNRN